MKLKKFNAIASISAFLLGTLYVFSDGAGVTANVIGASSQNAGITAIIGMIMIIGAIGLFIVSRDSTDHHSLDLERLLRRNNKSHEDINETIKREHHVDQTKTVDDEDQY